MFQPGDIVEHARGRWKGKRARVDHIENGYVYIETPSGVRPILQTSDLTVKRYPVIEEWLRALHRATDLDRLALKNALAARNTTRSIFRYFECEAFIRMWFALVCPRAIEK